MKEVKKAPGRAHLAATEDSAPFPSKIHAGNVILLCHPQAAATLRKNICCLGGEPVIKCSICDGKLLVSFAVSPALFRFHKTSYSSILFKLHLQLLYLRIFPLFPLCLSLLLQNLFLSAQQPPYFAFQQAERCTPCSRSQGWDPCEDREAAGPLIIGAMNRAR